MEDHNFTAEVGKVDDMPFRILERERRRALLDGLEILLALAELIFHVLDRMCQYGRGEEGAARRVRVSRGL